MVDVAQWSILVVEDEVDGQEVVSSLLSNFNITTETAFTAEEALKLLKHKNYTCAVIDLALPGMDGLSLVKRIRENPATAHIPCVALTAFHSSQVRQQAIAAGFNGYFPKPLEEMSFVRELQHLIGQST